MGVVSIVITAFRLILFGKIRLRLSGASVAKHQTNGPGRQESKLTPISCSSTGYFRVRGFPYAVTLSEPGRSGICCRGSCMSALTIMSSSRKLQRVKWQRSLVRVKRFYGNLPRTLIDLNGSMSALACWRQLRSTLP